MHPVVVAVTERIIERSRDSRQQYLQLMQEYLRTDNQRSQLGCTNLAHNYAAAGDDEKTILRATHRAANVGIVSAYNDLLSAHAPYQNYPEVIKQAVAEKGHVAQMAAGVPAMCDGITQGYSGMELSLFSRDTIALSTTVALSHQVFDGALMLGICDKIVPGLLMAALRFGHLPTIFVPAGPMASGVSNDQKATVRQQFAKGEVGQDKLLDSEMASYHDIGTCTFYGTANTNQVLMEIMGLQLPGSSFVAPRSAVRPLLTRLAAQRLVDITALESEFTPLMQIVDERTIVNGVVGLLATGGSTNHTLHLPAIAAMAGIKLEWQDIADLSDVIPLLCRIYPNGSADVNAFQQAGGMAFLIRELLADGYLHSDVHTIAGPGLERYTQVPAVSEMDPQQLIWQDCSTESHDLSVLAPVHAPFMREGGIKLLDGDIGRAILKVSALPTERWTLEAAVEIFTDQQAVLDAYKTGQLNRDLIIVVIHQGPAANGMPELHKLMPPLVNLQNEGYQVGLVTDGRLSGASGKVPAAIHVSPEAARGGAIGKLRNGDIIRIDGHSGVFQMVAPVDGMENWQDREALALQNSQVGVGRELFSGFRQRVTTAEEGAISISWENI